MKPQRIRPIAIFSLAAATLSLLAGCDTTTKLNEPQTAAPVEIRSAAAAAPAAPTRPATSAATPQSSVATVDLARGSAGAATAAAAAAVAAPSAGGTAAMAMPMQRVVYFDFDSYAIKDDYKGLIDVSARVLSGNKGKRLVVEGHTDERGGREYNLALGQKRAAAVVQSLTLLGVGDNQLEAVSFGKERPAVQGSEEEAWAKNRRAELKDR